jgi:predicted naringenin-chalcone synthase
LLGVENLPTFINSYVKPWRSEVVPIYVYNKLKRIYNKNHIFTRSVVIIYHIHIFI